MRTGVRLRLYVAGRSTPRTALTIERLRAALGSGGDEVALDVVDVYERPELAEEERILVTPTLVRLAPQPPLRIIGDLAAASDDELGRLLTLVDEGV